MQISTIELQIRVLDPFPERRRWNGGPFPSDAAHAARDVAVEAATAAVRNAGYTLVGIGFGVFAEECS